MGAAGAEGDSLYSAWQKLSTNSLLLLLLPFADATHFYRVVKVFLKKLSNSELH